MQFYQLLILILLTTLPFFPVQLDARISYGIIGFAILLLPIFIKNLKENIEKRDTITAFFILFLIACTISTIFSIDQIRSSQQLLLYHAFFVVFVAIRWVFPTQRSRELLAFCFLLIAYLLSLISLYHTLILHYVNRQAEGVSFMWVYYGHNHLSALLLFAIPIAFYFLRKQWHNEYLRLVLLVTCYLLLFSFFFTFAISSLISFAVSVFVTLLFVLKGKPFQRLMVTLVVGVLLGALLLGVGYFNRGFGLKKNNAISLQDRITYWQNGFDNVVKKPLVGSGLDTYRIINKESERQVKLPSYYAHNFFIQMLSDTGILGFLASITLITSIIWEPLKKIRNLKLEIRNLYFAFWVGMFASTLNALLDFDWQLPVVFFVFFIFAGLSRYAK